MTILTILGGFLSGLIPAFLKTAFAAATPLLVFLVEVLVGLLKRCWEGFLDVVDNISTVIFVLCLMAGTAAFVKYDSYQDCKEDKAALTKTLTKKKPATTTRPIHEWIPWING
jgi:hypothetical protein